MSSPWRRDRSEEDKRRAARSEEWVRKQKELWSNPNTTFLDVGRSAKRPQVVNPAIMPMPTSEQRASARIVTPVAAVPFSPAPAQYAPPPTSFTPVPVKQTFV